MKRIILHIEELVLHGFDPASRHAICARQGSSCGGASGRTWAGSPHTVHSHTPARTTVATEKVSSDARQPPNAFASGTASTAATAAPRLMPVA